MWCTGFSLLWLLLLQSMGSRAYGLQSFQRVDSVVVVHGLSCPRACEIFLARDQTHVPCIGRQIINYWTTREVPVCVLPKLFGEGDSQCSSLRLTAVPELEDSDNLFSSSSLPPTHLSTPHIYIYKSLHVEPDIH